MKYSLLLTVSLRKSLVIPSRKGFLCVGESGNLCSYTFDGSDEVLTLPLEYSIYRISRLGEFYLCWFIKDGIERQFLLDGNLQQAEFDWPYDLIFPLENNACVLASTIPKDGVFKLLDRVTFQEIARIVFDGYYVGKAGKYFIFADPADGFAAYDKEGQIWASDFFLSADFKAKFIGTHSSLLLIALTQNTIIALDIGTGQLVDKWQDERMAPELMALHTESGKLVGLCGYNYIEIDVMTKELHCISMEEHFKREQVIAMNIGQSHLDGKNIIFSSLGSDMNPFGKSKLAAFDIQSQQVVWQHEFPIPKRRPQVQDGRIFVVDDNKVLHVFEREDRGKAIIT